MADIQPYQALGPDGIQRRMQEIQSRLSAVFGKPANADPSFDETLKPFDIHGAGVNVRSSHASPQIKSMIVSAAQTNDVDPDLLDALVNAESSYDPSARSRAGAIGLSQLMPDTAKSLGVNDPFDPVQNLNGGAKYLRGLLDKFGDVPQALAAYNAGPHAVEKYGGIPPYSETKAYVNRIMSAYNARKTQ